MSTSERSCRAHAGRATMAAMRTMPVELLLEGRETAVVGCDHVIASKLARLLEAGAKVTLYTSGQAMHADVRALLTHADVRTIFRAPQPVEWDRYQLIFASPQLEAQCAALFVWSQSRGRPFCAIDRPEECTFVNPAAFSAGGMRMRIFSGGISPGLSSRIRKDLQQALDTDEMRLFLKKLAELRARTPRAERARVMGAAVQDFRLQARACYPAWLTEGRSEPLEVGVIVDSASPPDVTGLST